MLICLQDETRTCYEDVGTRPLEKKQDGGTQYTVNSNTLEQAMLKGQDVTVVIIYGTYASVSTTTLKRLP